MVMDRPVFAQRMYRLARVKSEMDLRDNRGAASGGANAREPGKAGACAQALP
jgi:hypothetical protein